MIWCQEEPANNGAWTFVDRRIESVLLQLGGAAKRPIYVGRDEAASPATGLAKVHAQQQAKLVQDALGLNSVEPETQACAHRDQGSDAG